MLGSGSVFMTFSKKTVIPLLCQNSLFIRNHYMHKNFSQVLGPAIAQKLHCRSYRSDRYHFVYLNGESSQLSPVKYGVPQGSVRLLCLSLIIHGRSEALCSD